MKIKPWCTQNSGDCSTCSLVSYGLDCMNNPVDLPDDQQGQPINLDEKQRKSLDMFNCPFCGTHFDSGFIFGGSDNREGGFSFCEECQVEFSWIDNPFECSILKGVNHEN